MSPFQRLGIDSTATVQELRRAYAALIKTYRPDSHPAEFVSIREAYEKALAIVQRSRPPASAPAEGRSPEDEGLVDWPTDGDVTGRFWRWILHLNTATPHVPDLLDVHTPHPAPSTRMRAKSPFPRTLLDNFHRPHGRSTATSTSPFRDELSAILATLKAQGEEAAVAPLEALLTRSRSMLLQDRMDLEAGLAVWLLDFASPPLRLAHIAAKEFAWTGQACVGNSLDITLNGRLKTIAALALDLAWFRHGGRPWLRHVFGTQASPPAHGAFAATCVLLEARRWTAHWVDRAQGIGVDVDRYLDAAARGRLRRGAAVQSTDLLLGVVLASLLSIFLVDRIGSLARACWAIAAIACATTLVAAAGRAAARAIRRFLAASPRWQSIASSDVHPFFVMSAVFLAGALLAILGSDAWQERGYMLMAVACVPLAGLAFLALWTVIEAAEDLLAASRLDLRSDRDRFRFENPASPAEASPAGRRVRDARARSRLEDAARRGERPHIPSVKLPAPAWIWRVAWLLAIVTLQFWHPWR